MWCLHGGHGSVMHVLNFSDMWNMEIFGKDFLNVLNTLYLYHISFQELLMWD